MYKRWRGKVTQPVAMKSSLWTVVVLSCLVEGSWSQRSRDRTNPHRQQQQQHQQQKQPTAADESDLTDECPEPNGYFADGYQCDKYYECKDGAITEKLCPDGMVFNDYSTLYEKCDLPFNLDCSQRSLMQDPKPSTHCPRQNGYFAHEDLTICDKFYFCVDGKFNMITCPSGLVYNEKTGICTWPDEAKKKHCSSEAESNRVKRVAFWKSDEETSSSKEMSEEDTGSYFDSSSVESGRKRKTDSAEYGSGSVEYPEYGAASGSAEHDSSYPNYDNAYDDPEFSNFDAEFQDFADAAGTGPGSYPGFSPHDFIKRKKDNLGDLDGYIKGYVKTIGKDPKKAAMGMDTKYYERIAEEVVEKEMEEEEARTDETSQGNRTTQNTSIRPMNLPHASRVGKPVSKSSASVPTIRKPRPGKHVPNAPYAGPILTLRKPANGVKWSYVPKPWRQLQPPPVQLTASHVSVLEVFRFACPKVDEKRAQQHPRYPDPEDCQFFYVCINGDVPRRNGCKLGQVFNEATGSCDWPRNVPECKEWYKGVLTDEELEALEHPKPKVRNNNYTAAAQKRKRPHQSAQYDLPN